MLIRVCSSRAPYRRGGVKFGKAKAWQEIDVEAVSVGHLIQLTADRHVCIERQGDDGAWTPMPPELRADARAWLDENHHRIDPELFDLKGEKGVEALRSILNSEGPTSAPAPAEGTQSLGASGEANGAPSGETPAGNSGVSNDPPAHQRKAKPAK